MSTALQKFPKIENGRRFGTLTVIADLGRGRRRVKCDCGTEKRMCAGNLNTGTIKSCGHLCKLMPTVLAVGQKYGHLEIIEMVSSRRASLRCECGNVIQETAAILVRNERLSCGCKTIRYKIGDIVNGRRVVELGKEGSRCLTVICDSCQHTAKVAAGYNKEAKCRHCGAWDSRQVSGFIYGIVCPYTGDIKYVGSTKGKTYHRVHDHWRERNASDNQAKPLYIWLRELARNGAMPGAIQIEHVEAGNLHEREIFWIIKMKQDNIQLLNQEHNRKGGLIPSAQL